MENVTRWQLCSVGRGTGSVSLLPASVAGDVSAVRSKVTVRQCSGNSMTDYLGRKYRMVSEDKFDDYMKALGVNIILRKVGTTVMSDFLLTEKDGVYHMAITSTFRNQYLEFRPGVETDETTLDHRKVKTVFTLTKDTLVQHQKGEKETTLVRKFSDEEIITTLTVDDIVATTVSKFVERV